MRALNGYTATIEKHGRFITKKVERCLEHGVFAREIEFLTLLKDSGFVPKIHAVDYRERAITMDGCGEDLTTAKLPSDAKLQAENIVDFLEILGIQHNDIRPANVTVKDGALFLIDFQWATRNTQPPAYWPQGLGGSYRAGWPEWRFSDRESFAKILAA